MSVYLAKLSVAEAKTRELTKFNSWTIDIGMGGVAQKAPHPTSKDNRGLPSGYEVTINYMDDDPLDDPWQS